MTMQSALQAELKVSPQSENAFSTVGAASIAQQPAFGPLPSHAKFKAFHFRIARQRNLSQTSSRVASLNGGLQSWLSEQKARRSQVI